MYHHNNNYSSADPYAGQYPPPPPVASGERHSSATPNYPYNQQQPVSDAYYNTPQPVAPIPAGNDYYTTPAAAVHGNDYYATSHTQGNTNNYYAPPAAANTSDHYNQQPPFHRSEAYDPSTYYPHPNTAYYEEIEDTPASPKTPIIDKSKSPSAAATTAAVPTSSKNNDGSTSPDTRKRKSAGFFGFRKNKSEPAVDAEKQQQSVPLHPVPAPVDEKPTYVVTTRPYEERGRTCCCYNPALTCCSVFCMLIALAFLAAGVAMMIASKVVTDKCTNECGSGDPANSDGSFTLPDRCTVICSDPLHKGLLYGGAVVAGLAGISAIWRFTMWCCAGYSRK
ncbi:hypothetical protein BX666DRAFT_1921668 [Dichotomocladium elegans]|nr:hypothetical protein BX666DRAFT_1921668 [Dichotomocladium elegans]